MKRYLHNELIRQFENERQMAFLSGPRQVGKTTLAMGVANTWERSQFFNWDDENDRKVIAEGTNSITSSIGLEVLAAGQTTLCVFDELHRYSKWRQFLKGFFDMYQIKTKTLVTGSASLRVFTRGGDSLMGRYFPYTLHPISVAELGNKNRQVTLDDLIEHEPTEPDSEHWESLCRFGGFPEPFLRSDQRFHDRWRSLRRQQFLREDIRDLTRIQEIDHIQLLADLLRHQVGQLTSYSHMARSVRVSVDTIRRWISTLESLFYCFAVRPWYKNVTRALRKEPKYYLWDWSDVDDIGARAENMVASALLKSIQLWTETGCGRFELFFVRDKQKNEVDFLITENKIPWFLVEVKSGGKRKLSKSLEYFQKQTGAKHAFQVAMDLDFVERSCFEIETPIIVPAKTFLSQLI